MRFDVVCSCLLLMATVRANPQDTWKWESSDKSSPSSTEVPVTTTSQINSFRVANQADSLHLAVAGKPKILLICNRILMILISFLLIICGSR